MIKFREHRGNLEESIKTAKEFNNGSELIDYLKEKFKVEKVKSSPYFQHYDCRVDWKKTHIITIDPGPGVLGFSDKPINEVLEMDDWIKKLQDNYFGNTGRCLIERIPNSYCDRVSLSFDGDGIALNGYFSFEEVEALLKHIKRYSKK